MSGRSAYPKTVKAGIPRLHRAPKGWVKCALGDVLEEISRPVELKDNEEYDLVTVKRARGGVEKRERLKGRDILVKSQFRVEAGDFLVSKRQIVHGACGIVPDSLAGSIVSNEYAVFKGKRATSLEYIRHLAATTYFQQTCFHSSIGVHVEKMLFNVRSWLKWEFNFPPSEEQDRIVELLGRWEQAIDVVSKMVENSARLKVALTQRLMPGGQLRGANCNSREFRLDEVAEVDAHTLGQSTPEDFEFRYISLSDVGPGTISSDLPILRFRDAPSRARRIVNVGDILMSTVRPSLRAFAIASNEHAGCVASTGFAVLSAKPGFDGAYIYHYLFSKQMSDQLEGLVVGSSYPSINSSDVKSLVISCPPIAEQRRIVKALDGVDSVKRNLESQLSRLKEQKAELVRQLLDGKLGVGAKERSVVASV